jgi:hypothetical protein
MLGRWRRVTSQRSSLTGRGTRTHGANGMGLRLVLQADNDFDSNGLALMDEFSDAIAACIADRFDGGIDVVSIIPVVG